MRTWPALDVSGLRGMLDAERVQVALADYDVAAVDETSDTAWRVFFHTPAVRDQALEALRTALPHVALAPIEIPDEDWAARSQADLRAIQVGSVIVAPPWDVPVTIVIRPSMGFGTGHHATTRLCLGALQRIGLEGRTALDVGTGSGVLAIAASRLGAREVTGVDDDADAVQAAWDNLALNPGATVSLIVGDFRRVDLVPVDVILANLTGGLLVSAAKRLRQLTNARGRLILSGFTTQEEQEVVAAYAAFSVEHRSEQEGWVCITLS